MHFPALSGIRRVVYPENSRHRAGTEGYLKSIESLNQSPPCCLYERLLEGPAFEKAPSSMFRRECTQPFGFGSREVSPCDRMHFGYPMYAFNIDAYRSHLGHSARYKCTRVSHVEVQLRMWKNWFTVKSSHELQLLRTLVSVARQNMTDRPTGNSKVRSQFRCGEAPGPVQLATAQARNADRQNRPRLVEQCCPNFYISWV